MLLLALFTFPVPSEDERNGAKMQLYQAGHITQTVDDMLPVIDRHNYVIAFHVAAWPAAAYRGLAAMC